MSGIWDCTDENRPVADDDNRRKRDRETLNGSVLWNCPGVVTADEAYERES